MLRVVPAIAAFHAQSGVISRAVSSFGPQNVIVLDVIRQGTADTAVGTDAFNCLRLCFWHERQRDRLVCQRPGRANGCTFAARNTGARAHRLIEIEADTRAEALASSADDFVGLNI